MIEHLQLKTAIKKNVSQKDIVSPGHVFPLVSKNGGVLVRAGHTEASVDVSKLSKCGSSGVICEIMNDDGLWLEVNNYLILQKNIN